MIVSWPAFFNLQPAIFFGGKCIMRYRIAAIAGLLAVCATGLAQTPNEFKGHTATVFAVAVSPDGNTLATGAYDGEVRLWDLKTGKLGHTLKHVGKVYSVAFNKDGSLLASSG